MSSKIGVTPLYIAAQNGHKEIVEALLTKEGIDVNQASKIGVTPLYIAAYNGHKEIVETLLTKEGIDVNRANEGGVTPLYAAAYNHQKDIVLLLAAYGAKLPKNSKSLLKKIFGKSSINDLTEEPSKDYSLARKMLKNYLADNKYKTKEDKKLKLEDFNKILKDRFINKGLEEKYVIASFSNMLLNKKWLMVKIDDEVFDEIKNKVEDKFGEGLTKKLQSRKDLQRSGESSTSSQIPSTTIQKPLFNRIMDLFQRKQQGRD